MKRSFSKNNKNKKPLKKVLNFLPIRLALAIFNFLFAKRVITLLTKQRIKTVTIGPITQICALSCLVWIAVRLIEASYHNEIVAAKSQEIKRLESINEYFDKEFSDANEKLEKVNEYLISINGGKHKVNFKKDSSLEFKKPEKIKKENLSSQDKQTLNEIKELETHLSQIRDVAKERIKKIETAIDLTGLNMKKIKVAKLKTKKVKEFSLNGKENYKSQGGPLVLEGSLEEATNKIFSEEELLEKNLKKSEFKNELDYLIILEKLAVALPLAKPMQNYYISSGFGSRTDPLTKRKARHEGLDFVGPLKEKILSPSSGTVILAGRFSDYGNAVVIDHGFGITTRYGHLSKVLVEKGQKVSQGDIIALQGSTGRSTGSHLHYEVRYKNVPLNPKKFLEAGNYILKDENKVSNYVNS